MFGIVTAPLGALPEQVRNRYRNVYCGLCHALGDRHGQPARMALTYDLTFLVLLLQSLYEPEEAEGKGRCVRHPLSPVTWRRSAITDYAADMTVVLTHFKCQDDWQDDRDLKARAFDRLLSGDLPRIAAQWPRQYAAIEEGLKAYNSLERNGAGAGELCDCFGRLMSQLFVWREDEWAAALRRLGHSLGEFICLMDAVLDYHEDMKHQNGSILTSMDMTPIEAQDMLKALCGHVTQVFEKLPLVQDIELLRSILYAGVWQQYQQMLEKVYHIHAEDQAAGQMNKAE